MSDASDPFEGWPGSSVAKTTPLASNDTVGALFLHVLNCLRDFHAVLQRTNGDFELLHVNAMQLPAMLESCPMHHHAFDRIEVSANFYGLLQLY